MQFPRIKFMAAKDFLKTSHRRNTCSKKVSFSRCDSSYFTSIIGNLNFYVENWLFLKQSGFGIIIFRIIVMTIFMYCLQKGFFEFSVLELMFQTWYFLLYEKASSCYVLAGTCDFPYLGVLVLKWEESKIFLFQEGMIISGAVWFFSGVSSYNAHFVHKYFRLLLKVYYFFEKYGIFVNGGNG